MGQWLDPISGGGTEAAMQWGFHPLRTRVSPNALKSVSWAKKLPEWGFPIIGKAGVAVCTRHVGGRGARQLWLRLHVHVQPRVAVEADGRCDRARAQR
jgi:hypothetical protein